MEELKNILSRVMDGVSANYDGFCIWKPHMEKEISREISREIDRNCETCPGYDETCFNYTPRRKINNGEANYE